MLPNLSWQFPPPAAENVQKNSSFTRSPKTSKFATLRCGWEKVKQTYSPFNGGEFNGEESQFGSNKNLTNGGLMVIYHGTIRKQITQETKTRRFFSNGNVEPKNDMNH